MYSERILTMKKIISILLIVATMLVILASCTGSQKTDWEYIEEKGKLTVGVTVFKPMNWQDESGAWTGFETEFAQEVGKILGVEVEFVIIEWEKKVTELKSRNIDLIWNGMTVTDELLTGIDVSKSYIKNWQVAVVHKDNLEKYTTLESMKDAKVAVESKSAGQKAAEANENLKNNIVPLSGQTDALREVFMKTSDVAIIDYVMAIASVGKEGTDYADLVMVNGIELGAEEYAIGIRKDSPVTKQKIDAAIDQLIQNGKLNELAVKYGIADQLISNQDEK